MPAFDWRKYLKFRCTGCGNCCRGTVVLITDDDVNRIVQGIGRDPRDFVRFYDEERVEIAKSSPWWIRVGAKRAVMALRWQRGPRCIFLSADNDCTIYEHRPVVCREHPFNVTLSESGAVQRMTINRVVDCPHDWDGNRTRREIGRVARWNQRQADDFTGKIKTWNRGAKSRTRPGFLRFLGLIPAR